MRSILAGLVIAIGAICNLTVGGYLGPIVFAVGLMSVLLFEMDLFTGKAGLLASGEIDCAKLASIWCGNFIGCAGGTIIAMATPQFEKIISAAKDIVMIRNSNSSMENFILGIGCGILMYIAVNGYKKTKNFIAFILPVVVFILCGFNHCVADMFYLSIGAIVFGDFVSLLPTTLGNICGCCVIPVFKAQQNLHIQ